VVYCDNVSAVYLSRNPVQHQLLCMLTLIYTSSESESPSVRSASCMFPLRHSTPMSSTKVCRHQSSQSLGPDSMYAVLLVSTVGECWRAVVESNSRHEACYT
jgi:hypothetical protein